MDQRQNRARDGSLILESIQRTRLFAGLPDAAVERLCQASHLKTYEDGECITRYGDACTGLLVIGEGCIETSRTKANGRRLVFDYAQPGQVMGTFAAFDGMGSPLDNYARGQTRVVFIPYEIFLSAIREYPDLAIGMIAMHTRRSRLDFERIFSVLDSMRVRVAKFLLYLSRGPESGAKPFEVPVRISQDDIADLLGVTRASVNKVLVAMVREKILERHYTKVVVRDVKKLMDIISEDESLSPDLEQSLLGRSRKFFPTTD